MVVFAVNKVIVEIGMAFSRVGVTVTCADAPDAAAFLLMLIIMLKMTCIYEAWMKI